MSTPVVLKIYRGDRLISVKQFDQEQIVIGRQSDSALSLDDESISPLHAVIEKRNDSYFVADLGSDSGIYLEGSKTLESEIKSGQVLDVGPYSIRFYIGVPKQDSKNSDFERTHDKPRMSKERLPDLPEIQSKHVEMFTPENTNPGIEIDDEITNSGIEMDDEITNSGVDTTPDNTDPGLSTSASPVEIQKVSGEDNNTVEVASSGYAAPKSEYKSVDEIINPSSRGSVVEVIIAWQERILKTYHFSDKQKVKISNVSGSDMYIPLPGNKFTHELLDIDDLCSINIASSMAGELYKNGKVLPLSELPKSNKLQQIQGGSVLKLDQGEMLRIGLLSNKVSAYVRYVEDAPKATSAPFFDFTSSELVGIFMSAVVVSVIALYMLFYSPASLADPDSLLEDSLKKAVITFNPPIKYVPPPKPIEKEETKVVTKPVRTKVTEKKSPKPSKKPKAQKSELKAGSKTGDGTNKSGKPKAAAPSKNRTKNKAGSSRPGGSVKTGKAAANAKSKQVDVTKVGLMGALSGGGKNTALDKAYSGVGTTIGTADSKTGYQGQLSDQKGDGIGTKLQKAGSGGSGSSLVGVGGITTSGRGGGKLGYGAGGLGGKGKANITIVDGVGDDFYSSIDQDAIRRLIRKNRNLLSGCYEIALAKNKNIKGKVVLQWNIRNGGKMTNGKVKKSDIGDKNLANCIIRRLSTLKFPDPGPNEIAEVSYPFVFEAR